MKPHQYPSWLGGASQASSVFTFVRKSQPRGRDVMTHSGVFLSTQLWQSAPAQTAPTNHPPPSFDVEWRSHCSVFRTAARKTCCHFSFLNAVQDRLCNDTANRPVPSLFLLTVMSFHLLWFPFCLFIYLFIVSGICKASSGESRGGIGFMNVCITPL